MLGGKIVIEKVREMKVLKTRNERKVRKSGIKPLKYFFFDRRLGTTEKTR